MRQSLYETIITVQYALLKFFTKKTHNLWDFIFCFLTDYIIPIPGLAAGAGVSSLMMATADSVVSNVDATLVAF